MSSKNEKGKEIEKSVSRNLPFEKIQNLLSARNWVYEKSAEHLKQFALSVEQYNVLLILLRLKGLLTREQSKENRRKVEIRLRAIRKLFDFSLLERYKSFNTRLFLKRTK